MADTFSVYKYCTACEGTGEVQTDDEPFDAGPPEELDCPECDGEGKTLWGIIIEDE